MQGAERSEWLFHSQDLQRHRFYLTARDEVVEVGMFHAELDQSALR